MAYFEKEYHESPAVTAIAALINAIVENAQMDEMTILLLLRNRHTLTADGRSNISRIVRWIESDEQLFSHIKLITTAVIETF
ncbi:MAG: hypothetical protein ACREPR_21795 [Brasilonema sp.]